MHITLQQSYIPAERDQKNGGLNWFILVSSGLVLVLKLENIGNNIGPQCLSLYGQKQDILQNIFFCGSREK